MEECVKKGGLESKLVLSDHTIEWKPLDKKSTSKNTGSISLASIFGVSLAVNDPRTFRVHWAAASSAGKVELAARECDFTCPEEVTCQRWITGINDKLRGYERPRRLLVVINPRAGQQTAEQIYQEHAAPLFALANVDTHVIITERKQHAKELLKEYDLTSVDGVVSVGGDGTFSECLNGLILNANKDEGGEFHSGATPPVSVPHVKMAAIAAGSWCMVANSLNKTKDVTTAVLNTILGREGKPLNVCSVFSGNRFMGYSFLMTGLGMCADVTYDVERETRGQASGVGRYALPFIKNMFTRRPVDLNVNFKRIAITGTENKSDEKKLYPPLASEESVAGRFVDLYVLPLELCHNVEERGGAKFGLVKECNIFKHLQYFCNDGKGQLDHVIQGQIVEVNVKINGGGKLREDDRYTICLDGEVMSLPEPEFSVRVFDEVVGCY